MFFRKLLKGTESAQEQAETVTVLDRALRAVLAEVLSLIRSLPDPLRLAEISDPLWQQIVDARIQQMISNNNVPNN